MFHSFNNLEGKVNMPQRFTFPFFYTPHPLSVEAANELRHYLISKVEWERELSLGKMFGVLVVVNQQKQLGFLAAFSGQIAGSYNHDYFVPPIYDLNSPDSFFKEEEKKISDINSILNDTEFLNKKKSLTSSYQKALCLYEEIKKETKEFLQKAKEERDRKRQLPLNEYDEKTLIKESQFLKAEAKRKIKEYEYKVEESLRQLNAHTTYEETLKQQRKQMSFLLQNRLFEQFVFRNAKGETKSLVDIFSPNIPPSGAGECAAPKLLQYAYENHYQPICMAEFWWGKSPSSLIRRHGKFYPSCTSKCKPILSFMLQGLSVESNPLALSNDKTEQLPVLYEDDYLLVINKPCGLLSAPGLLTKHSVQTILQEKYHDSEIKVVHRLDMSTSGLLLVAKRENVYIMLQEMFSNRLIKKRYLALLDGIITSSKGRIDLPLSSSWEYRPYQIVSLENGKDAITDYELIEIKDGKSKVWFYPLTGRTHQLRLHSAHSKGLNCPIVGDELYGESSDRLYLQAQRIEFEHPITHKRLKIELPNEF